jgi:hypothetical protein
MVFDYDMPARTVGGGFPSRVRMHSLSRLRKAPVPNSSSAWPAPTPSSILQYYSKRAALAVCIKKLRSQYGSEDG